MRVKSTVLLATFLLALFFSACATVPITDRRQVNLIPRSNILSMSFQQYDQFLQNHELSQDQDKVRTVEEVGNKVKTAVQQYFKERDRSEELQGYEWEFHLVADDKVNAFCMPGGKVVIYEGILDVAQNRTGLAVVMSHEIAHAIAQHGNERMSQQLITKLGGMALAQAVKEKPEQTQQLWMAAFGIGAQVGVLLPYSRLHESEADQLGIMFMAMAGYDPRAAVDFWQRMAEQSKSGSPPEFLSTHPSDQSRVENIKEHLPRAMEYYRQNN